MTAATPISQRGRVGAKVLESNPKSATKLSEDLRAPRLDACGEQRVGARDRAGNPLHHTARALQLGEGEAAEVDAPELGDIQADIPLDGHLLCSVAGHAPGPLAGDLERHLAVAERAH